MTTNTYFPLNPGNIVYPNHTDLLVNGAAWLGTDTGTSANYLVTFDGSAANGNAITTLNTGFTLRFLATNPSAAGATLTLQGANGRTYENIPITKQGGQKSLAANDVIAGQLVSVIYNANGSSPRFELIASGASTAGATGAAGPQGLPGSTNGAAGPTGPTGPAAPSGMFSVGPANSSTQNNPSGLAANGNYVYVANVSNGSISQFQLGSVGALQLVGVPVSAIVSPCGLAFSGTNLYVTSYSPGVILQFSVGAEGALTAVGTAASGLSNPYGIKVNGSKLYVVNRNAAVSIFDIGAGGALTASGTTASGTSNVDIAFSGSYAYISNPTSATIAQMSVQPDGTLNLIASKPCPTDKPFGLAATSTHLYAVSNASNTITKYLINADGTLTLTGTVDAGGADPQGIVIVGPYAYVSSNNNNSVWQYNTADSTP